MNDRPTNPQIQTGMQAALNVTRPMRPFEKHALTHALASTMPDAADLLFALLDVEKCEPGDRDYGGYLDTMDKAFCAYFGKREDEHAETQADDPFDRGFQERRTG